MPLSLNRLEATLFALGLSGIATLFLPFAEGYSPLRYLFNVYGVSKFDVDGVSNFLTQVPILLPIPISAISFLHLVSPRLARPAWIAAYTFGFCGAALVLTFLARFSYDLSYGSFGPSSGWDWFLALAFPSAFLIGGGVLVVRNLRRGVAHAQNAINIMQVAFASYAVFYLIGLYDSWDAGAYVAMFAIVAYASHVVLAPELARREIELRFSG